MKKLTAICLSAFLTAAAFSGCNSDYEPDTVTSTCVAVKSFALTKDDSIMANLDTVFFSINLEEGKIFNADSLPCGTKVNKLIPRISFLEGVSGATLSVTCENGTDTVYNYITNSTDSIDFTNPVKLTVTSLSGMASMTYEIKVNVHKLVSDSLEWSRTASMSLPTDLSGSPAQRTVKTSEGIYVLTSSGTAFSMARADNPEAEWEYFTPALPAGADYHSLAGGIASLYILADKTIYASTDGGRSWTSTGVKATHIYGCYEDTAIAVLTEGKTSRIVSYPACGVSATLPEGMPIADTSVPVTVKFPLAAGPQMIMCGGTLANGSLSGDTWAFDGTNWANITLLSLPEGLKNVAIVPFFSFTINTAFIATEHSVLLAFGGRSKSAISDKTYLSFDFGMTWLEGSSLIQLPDYIAPFYDAQTYTYDKVLTPSRSIIWSAPSRATTPVESWDCPYIYIFGGVDKAGNTSQKVWRGTLNRLQSKPII